MNLIRRQINVLHRITMQRTSVKRKVKNKIASERTWTGRRSETMMIGIVSRLTDQKGFDLIAYVMDETVSGCSADRVYLEPEKNDMRICSVILHGNIRKRYLHRSIILSRCHTNLCIL